MWHFQKEQFGKVCLYLQTLPWNHSSLTKKEKDSSASILEKKYTFGLDCIWICELSN